MDPYFILFIAIALASWGISALLNHRFKQYSKVYLPLTGREVAEKMYQRHTILSELLISLGVSEETAIDDACKIEHDISEKTFEAIKKHVENL